MFTSSYIRLGEYEDADQWQIKPISATNMALSPEASQTPAQPLAAILQCDAAIQSPKTCTAILEKDGLPEKAVLASLGCGNPTALTELKPGETVLDLGSGGGIDVLLSAKRVGPTGKAYGSGYDG